VIWEFCCDDPEVRIIGSTLDGAIELMTIGEIYPSPYGPGTKGIDPRKF
jgi:cytidine deaminase